MGERSRALPWIRRGDYGDVKRLMEDGEAFAETYEEWLRHAERQENDIAERGVATERVMIEPWEFEVWCAAMGFAKDNEARWQFAAENASLSPSLTSSGLERWPSR